MRYSSSTSVAYLEGLAPRSATPPTTRTCYRCHGPRRVPWRTGECCVETYHKRNLSLAMRRRNVSGPHCIREETCTKDRVATSGPRMTDKFKNMSCQIDLDVVRLPRPAGWEVGWDEKVYSPALV